MSWNPITKECEFGPDRTRPAWARLCAAVCLTGLAGLLVLPGPAASESAFDGKLVRLLEEHYPIEQGYYVSGGLGPSGDWPEAFAWCLRSPRVVVEDVASLYAALNRLDRLADEVEVTGYRGFTGKAADTPPGYRGIWADLKIDGRTQRVQFVTVAMNRWLLWVRTLFENEATRRQVAEDPGCLRALSDFLAAGQRLGPDDRPGFPSACRSGYGSGFYAEPGFDAIDPLALVRGRAAFRLSRFKGLRSFTAGEEVTRWLIQKADGSVYPERAAGRLQREYDEPPEAGAPAAPISTLTAANLERSPKGVYAFAVDSFDRARFTPVGTLPKGFPLKHARGACPGFLFPGEPVKVAGYFHSRGHTAALDRITLFSTHHFYPSNRDEWKTDPDYSDRVFMSVGHFLAVCAREGIDTTDAVLEKVFTEAAFQEERK